VLAILEDYMIQNDRFVLMMLVIRAVAFVR